MPTEKDERTEQLRSLVQLDGESTETDRADSGLTTLSFQSLRHPNRHVWVDTDLAGDLVIDLEDWEKHGAWDNSIDHLTATTIEEGRKVISAWLSGKPVALCHRLCNESTLDGGAKDRKRGTGTQLGDRERGRS